jgi:hypothetical protein
MTRPQETYEVVETPHGVRYRIYQRRGITLPNPLGCLPLLAVPLAGAVLTVLFLVDHYRALSWPLRVLPLLFVAQMLYVARIPWKLFRGQLWRKLVYWFGHGELELRGGRFWLGSRVGPLRVGSRRDVSEFRRVVVYIYPQKGKNVPEQDRECHVLSIECDNTAPLHLIAAFPREMTLALAEDLNHRLGIAPPSAGVIRKFPPVEVIATQEEQIYPEVVDADSYHRRWPRWLAWHLSGVVGLGALMFATGETGAGNSPLVHGLLFVAILLETMLIALSLVIATAGAREAKRKKRKPTSEAG